jgi:Toxin SymE, type I toxin-antitoxin system
LGVPEDLKLSELLEGTAGPALAAALKRWEWKREKTRRARVAGRRRGPCGRWSRRERVPDLWLSGRWLRAAGFDLGQAYEVEVRSGRLVIRAV